MSFQKRIYTNMNSLKIIKEKLIFNASTQTVGLCILRKMVLFKKGLNRARNPLLDFSERQKSRSEQRAGGKMLKGAGSSP